MKAVLAGTVPSVVPGVRAPAQDDYAACFQMHDFAAIQYQVNLTGQNHVVVDRLRTMSELCVTGRQLRFTKRRSLPYANPVESLKCFTNPALCAGSADSLLSTGI